MLFRLHALSFPVTFPRLYLYSWVPGFICREHQQQQQHQQPFLTKQLTPWTHRLQPHKLTRPQVAGSPPSLHIPQSQHQHQTQPQLFCQTTKHVNGCAPNGFYGATPNPQPFGPNPLPRMLLQPSSLGTRGLSYSRSHAHANCRHVAGLDPNKKRGSERWILGPKSEIPYVLRQGYPCCLIALGSTIS